MHSSTKQHFYFLFLLSFFIILFSTFFLALSWDISRIIYVYWVSKNEINDIQFTSWWSSEVLRLSFGVYLTELGRDQILRHNHPRVPVHCSPQEMLQTRKKNRLRKKNEGSRLWFEHYYIFVLYWVLLWTLGWVDSFQPFFSLFSVSFLLPLHLPTLSPPPLYLPFSGWTSQWK